MSAIFDEIQRPPAALSPKAKAAVSTTWQGEELSRVWQNHGMPNRAVPAATTIERRPRVHMRVSGDGVQPKGYEIFDLWPNGWAAVAADVAAAVAATATAILTTEPANDAQANPQHVVAIASDASDARWIKDALALSMSELATLLNVTRKTVYDWFGGALPRSEPRERFAAIRSVFAEVSRTNAEKLRFVTRVWASPLAGGRSLLSELDQIDSLASEHVDRAREILLALDSTLDDLVKQSQESYVGHDLGTAHTEDLFRST